MDAELEAIRTVLARHEALVEALPEAVRWRSKPHLAARSGASATVWRALWRGTLSPTGEPPYPRAASPLCPTPKYPPSAAHGRWKRRVPTQRWKGVLQFCEVEKS
jgi:hypothetical protein